MTPDFFSWKWQLQNSVKTAHNLAQYAHLCSEQKAWLKDNFLLQKLPFSLTPYFASLISPQKNCPIFTQVVCQKKELDGEPFLRSDPLGETSRQTVKHLVHRYPDRVLFLATDRCASYCRFCTRKRWVGQGPTPNQDNYQEAFSYIAKHSQIREIIFSGGDPMILSDEKIKNLLERAYSIPHIQFVRFHSRILSFLPMRITLDLANILASFEPVYFVTHFNHPNEITSQTKKAIKILRNSGVILLNQSVLLKNINNDTQTLSSLFSTLVSLGVKPYYLHQCDLIHGSKHFRVPIKESVALMEQLRGHLSGLCIPTFMIETPGGFGKNPLMPNPIVKEDDKFIYIKGFDGKVSPYPKDDSASL